MTLAGGAARGEAMAPADAAAGTASGLGIAGVTKRFGGFTAVDAVDLEVRRGEFLTLLGPSGSGKTTLLMMIAGFVEPTAGEIRLDGRAITRLLPEQRNFGMVFQGYALFPHMTVRGNVAYPLEVRGRPKAEIAATVRAMLELVQLQGLADRYPRQLSGGQQQRVALARALAFRPPLLLLDEPLGALDRKLRGEVQEQLKDLHRRTGTTFVYVTHDQDEALSMSDRIAIMNHGRIVQVGTPTELYERPVSQFAAGFLGKSNFIAVRVAGRQGATLACEAGGETLRQASGGGPVAAGARVTLALRPEKIALLDRPAAEGDGNAVPARITRTSYFGSVLEVEADAGPLGLLIATLPAWRNQRRYEAGQSVWLAWPEDAAVIVAVDGAEDKGAEQAS
jgi:putative spermidine/putrescine transport system ATP-binding protein